MNWEIIDKKNHYITSQSKLEQRFLNGEAESSERFRQKFIFKLPNMLFNKYSLVFSEELFVNISRPSWISTRIIDQNRAFLGVDIPTSKQTYIEVGYLNQYRFEETTTNKMNNIAYIGFNINA